jgi:NADH-quinone oxidoreductase subunit A
VKVGDYLVVAAFLALGVLFVIATLSVSSILQPHKPNAEKYSTYECGSEPIGPPWVQFHIGYYVYALLFVMFDIETVFLYPWAVAFGARIPFILIDMFVFLAVIGAGLAYAWKEGALQWR